MMKIYCAIIESKYLKIFIFTQSNWNFQRFGSRWRQISIFVSDLYSMQLWFYRHCLHIQCNSFYCNC